MKLVLGLAAGFWIARTIYQHHYTTKAEMEQQAAKDRLQRQLLDVPMHPERVNEIINHTF